MKLSAEFLKVMGPAPWKVVAVPIDDCAVRVGGIMAAVVLGAEAGDAILGPIFFREEGLRSILCGSLTAT